MANELKHCPFCGGKTKFSYNALVHLYFVVCPDCGAIVSFNGKETQKRLCEAYNRRVDNG
ncbi:MAG: Lar family restriction alleviation protein [Clostridia bacterium]|nr:Lar family restriction alleviation protein [Clostridia bacterium]